MTDFVASKPLTGLSPMLLPHTYRGKRQEHEGARRAHLGEAQKPKGERRAQKGERQKYGGKG